MSDTLSFSSRTQITSLLMRIVCINTMSLFTREMMLFGRFRFPLQFIFKVSAFVDTYFDLTLDIQECYTCWLVSCSNFYGILIQLDGAFYAWGNELAQQRVNLFNCLLQLIANLLIVQLLYIPDEKCKKTLSNPLIAELLFIPDEKHNKTLFNTFMTQLLRNSKRKPRETIYHVPQEMPTKSLSNPLLFSCCIFQSRCPRKLY